MIILRFILSILLLICLIVLQISFLSRWETESFLNPALIDLVFVFLLIFLIFGRLKYGLLVALAGGVLLDLYSVFVPGLYLTALIIALVVSLRLIKQFSQITLPSVFILAFSSGFVYQISILAINWLAGILNLQAPKIILDRFYWTDFLGGMILNSLVISGVFLVVKIVSNRRYKRI